MGDFPYSFNSPVSGNKTLDNALAVNFRAAQDGSEPSTPGVSNIPPVGFIGMWGSTTIPAGWLQANGQAVSRTTYSELFAVYGTTFGTGDGSTTFNIPNFNGRVPVGSGSAGTGDGTAGSGVISGGTAITAITIGAWQGATTHLLTTGESGQKAVTSGAESADHSHSGTTGGITANHTHGGYHRNTTIGGSAVGDDAVDYCFDPLTHGYNANTGTVSVDHGHAFTTGGRSATHTHSISGSSAASAHPNRQPQLGIVFVVKALSTATTGVSTAVDSSDPRLSDARAPTGAAGGHLTGSYPLPSIANGVITDVHISSLTSASISDFNTAVLATQSQIAFKAEGLTIATRRAINFVQGGGMEITVADDAVNQEVDVTLAFAGSANLDGGFADSTYGGIEAYDGGGA